MTIKDLTRQGAPLCTIHTIEVVSSAMPCGGNDFALKCARSGRNWTNRKTGEINHSTIINLQKWGGFMPAYLEGKSALDELLNELGVLDYRLSRVDYSLDFFADNFKQMSKLHRALAILTANASRIENCYDSRHLLSLRPLTVRVQGEYLEFENYNKMEESHGTSPVCNRLELRSKALLRTNKDIPAQILQWCVRLKKAANGFDRLAQVCNPYLLALWKEESNEISVYEFLRKYQCNFFTRRQILAFLVELEYTNAESRMKYFSRTNHIEFLSKGALQAYVDILCRALKGYLDGTQKSEVFVPKQRIHIAA